MLLSLGRDDQASGAESPPVFTAVSILDGTQTHKAGAAYKSPSGVLLVWGLQMGIRLQPASGLRACHAGDRTFR